MEKRERINSAQIPNKTNKANKGINSKESSFINKKKIDIMKEKMSRNNNNLKNFHYSYSLKRNLSDISTLRPNLKINIFPNNKTFKYRKKKLK